MSPGVDLLVPDAPAQLTADVCIVGGGTAGALLARRLADAGVRTVMLEAGNERSLDARSVGLDAQFDGQPYRGALEGRAFGLGGSSSRWGGVLAPSGALETGREMHEPWSTIADVTAEHVGRVRTLLGARSPPDYAQHVQRASPSLVQTLEAVGIRTSSAEMLPFGARNLRRLLRGRAIERSLTTVVNAVVARWSIEGSVDGLARLARVEAVSAEARTIQVTAKEFVLAAGALESARILLEIDDVSRGKALAGRAAIGRGLSDHLSIPIADVESAHLEAVLRDFAPRFDGRLMKTVRMADLDVVRSGLRHFAHFLFLNEDPGFQLAKKVLFDLQARKLPAVTTREIVRGLRGVAALFVERVLRSRLHVPRDTPVVLQLDVEQESVPDNALVLGGDRDVYGRRRAVIRWGVSERDRDRIRSCAASFLAKWRRAGDRLPAVVSRPLESGQSKPHDAYHPVGLTRMGSESDAVVDLRLKVRGTHNLSLVSTGVFPTAGSANPTLSMLCLADRLADDLIERCARVR